MNILFIGGAGFIGSSLVKRFVSDRKYLVFILEPEFANISRLNGYDLTVFRNSLSNINEVKNILLANNIEVVVHLVSTLIPGSNYDDYVNEFKNVIFPSIELMEFCANEKIKFVYFSSGGTIYGNRTTFQPFVETDNMEPISYYGWSKQMMENSILFKNRTQNLKYLIIRPSNPYGHGQNLYGKQGLVAVAIGKIIENKSVEVWGVDIWMALGATIDFEAGNVKRAPKWMQKLAMEWFYRFLMEPKRMFRRYFVDDVKFFWYFGRQLLGIYRNPFKD